MRSIGKTKERHARRGAAFGTVSIGAVASTGVSHPFELGLLAHRLRRAAESQSSGAMSTVCFDVAQHLESLAFRSQGQTRDPQQVEAIRKALPVRSKGSILLLLELMEKPGRVSSHEHLIRALESTRGALKVYICDLRKGLEAMGLDDPIQTIWGVGYCLSKADAARIQQIWT